MPHSKIFSGKSLAIFNESVAMPTITIMSLCKKKLLWDATHPNNITMWPRKGINNTSTKVRDNP